MTHTPMKLRIKRLDNNFFCHWKLIAPPGFMFGADESINRSFALEYREFFDYESARQYVADGRAQRALIPAESPWV